MNGSMPGTAFEPECEIDELLDLRIAFNAAFSSGTCLQRLRDTYVSAADRRRNELCDLLDIAEIHIQRAADVLDRGPRRHCPECDDLADGFASVKLRNMIDHVAASANAEVDVDIGHRYAFRIQEALE